MTDQRCATRARAALLALAMMFAVPAGAVAVPASTPAVTAQGGLLTPVQQFRFDRDRERDRDGRRGRGRGRDRDRDRDDFGRRGSRDCHRGVERHRLPGYRGSVVHRHVGRNCRAIIFDREDRGRRGRGRDRGRDCIDFGPVRFCEN